MSSSPWAGTRAGRGGRDRYRLASAQPTAGALAARGARLGHDVEAGRAPVRRHLPPARGRVLAEPRAWSSTSVRGDPEADTRRGQVVGEEPVVARPQVAGEGEQQGSWPAPEIWKKTSLRFLWRLISRSSMARETQARAEVLQRLRGRARRGRVVRPGSPLGAPSGRRRSASAARSASPVGPEPVGGLLRRSPPGSPPTSPALRGHLAHPGEEGWRRRPRPWPAVVEGQGQVPHRVERRRVAPVVEGHGDQADLDPVGGEDRHLGLD